MKELINRSVTLIDKVETSGRNQGLWLIGYPRKNNRTLLFKFIFQWLILSLTSFQLCGLFHSLSSFPSPLLACFIGFYCKYLIVTDSNFFPHEGEFPNCISSTGFFLEGWWRHSSTPVISGMDSMFSFLNHWCHVSVSVTRTHLLYAFRGEKILKIFQS